MRRNCQSESQLGPGSPRQTLWYEYESRPWHPGGELPILDGVQYFTRPWWTPPLVSTHICDHLCGWCLGENTAQKGVRRKPLEPQHLACQTDPWRWMLCRFCSHKSSRRLYWLLEVSIPWWYTSKIFQIAILCYTNYAMLHSFGFSVVSIA